MGRARHRRRRRRLGRRLRRLLATLPPQATRARRHACHHRHRAHQVPPPLTGKERPCEKVHKHKALAPERGRWGRAATRLATVHPAPPCSALGSQCQEIPVTLRIGSLEQGASAADHEATWLLGHTERISFRNLRARGPRPAGRCRPPRPLPAPQATPRRSAGVCAAHRLHTGPFPPPSRGAAQPRQLGGEKFLVVEDHALAAVALKVPPRSLPVVDGDLIGGESLFDRPVHHGGPSARLGLLSRPAGGDPLFPLGHSDLEALVRSRLSPYLCKITRASEDALEAEMISACGYLDGRGSELHPAWAERPDGRPAKPDLCSEWPDNGKGLHPGCIFYTPPAKKSKKRQ